MGTTPRSVPLVGSWLIQGELVMCIRLDHKMIWEAVTSTQTTTLTRMAARCTVAMVTILAKTALVVVSVIALVVIASVSVDTLALLVSRWNRWLSFIWRVLC